MTKAISMAIELDQDIMVTSMCVKFGEDWTNSFRRIRSETTSGRTYGRTRASLSVHIPLQMTDNISI